METFSIPSLAQNLQTEADAYRFLEDLRWHGFSPSDIRRLTPKSGWVCHRTHIPYEICVRCLAQAPEPVSWGGARDLS